MDAVVRRVQKIRGSIVAPPSKSYTHRAFVVASLAEGTSVVRNPLLSGDTLSTLNAIQAFGIRVEVEKDIVIHGRGGDLETPTSPIDCENSGTTIRLIAGVASLDARVTLTGDESVQKRPMQPLLDALKQLGVYAYSVKNDGTPPVVIEGGSIKGGLVRIRGDISSQFISSLLIISPYAENDVILEITTPLKSRPYVDITLDVMEKFGVLVEQRENRYYIRSGKRYSPTEYHIEGDYSSAAYFLALAAMSSSEIIARNLRRESKQGDKVIVDILAKMGAEVRWVEDGVLVKGGKLKAINIDLGDTPDLLPTVTALACLAEGTTIIRNVEHARYKETDRISACAKEFRKFGVRIEEKEDGLVIHGKESLAGAIVKSYGDHRMAMALAIAGLSAEGKTIVKDIDCVRISFPAFFNMVRDLAPWGSSLIR